MQWRTGFANHFARRVRVLGLFLSRTRTEPTWRRCPCRIFRSLRLFPGKLLFSVSRTFIQFNYELLFQLFPTFEERIEFLKIRESRKILACHVSRQQVNTNIVRVWLTCWMSAGVTGGSAIEFSFMPDGSLIGNRDQIDWFLIYRVIFIFELKFRKMNDDL